MSSGATVIIGAAFSGCIGLIVVLSRQRLDRRRYPDQGKITRLAEFSAAAWAITLVLGDLARVSLAQKPDLENFRRFQQATDRFNSLLAQI